MVGKRAGSLVSLRSSFEAPGIIIVYLYEQECPACREFEPSWRLFKDMHRGEATFMELSIEGLGEKLASSMKVKYIPAVLVFRNGVLISRVEGLPDIKDLEYSLLRAKEEKHRSLRL